MNKSGGEKIISKIFMRLAFVVLPLLLATGCASVDVPDGRTVKVPTVTPPLDRFEALNEKRDPVTRVRLGRDVLVPQPLKEDVMPDTVVGPYELRNETLASALQLILDDYDVSIAFESDEGLKRRVTISNLHGKMKDVINRVCSLADLYCHFEAGTLTIKKTETFVVDLPPINASSSSSSGGTSSSTTTSTSTTTASSTGTTGTASTGDAYTQIAAGLEAVIGTTPVVDSSTRVMIYTATQRSNKYALQYFERLRKNTALIIFETHIWEVALNNSNRTGINWSALFSKAGTYSIDLALTGAAPTGAATPISITPAYTGSGNITTDAILEFISERGTVKTVSQPQIAVLSGSSASLAVSQQENFVKGITRTPATATTAETVSTTTDTVTTGLTMNVTSAWDHSTVYGNLSIVLDDLLKIDEFNPDDNTTIQLPQTTKRSLQTEIRVRPGDAILIGGLVSEKNDLSESGPGFMKPLFATARGVTKKNSELVFLLRPRVVAFVQGDEKDTPPVTDAPKDGAATPDITNHVSGLFGQSNAPPEAAAGKADLPDGISAEAFAPQGASASPVSIAPAASDEALPDSMKEQSAPVSLTAPPPDKDDKTPATDQGSLSR